MLTFQPASHLRRLLLAISLAPLLTSAQHDHPNPQSGYEQAAKAENEKLNDMLMRLDTYIRNPKLCSILGEYQRLLEDAMAQSRKAQSAWSVVFDEQKRTTELLIERAKAGLATYEEEKHRMRSDRETQRKELDELRRKYEALPNDAPEAKAKLKALISSVEAAQKANDDLMLELDKENVNRKQLIEIHEMIASAQSLMHRAKEGYFRADRLLMDVRYSRPIDRCLGLPNSPLRGN